ncbi:uncharacterized protein CLUP02_06064 [Colletotrichum lupini]|uniref:Uncharacterized protein n=1 Tax=Colletotrichum lupini TaxID=145971 RepID=A0A9Q8SNF5_9PEZI|nr:uncharacterized protein CLUP02_06064 [Colletotrichum lupini]UQC80581.1 hypothetical protein CLUP02_06064 [Colletotrichum lupini]
MIHPLQIFRPLITATLVIRPPPPFHRPQMTMIIPPLPLRLPSVPGATRDKTKTQNVKEPQKSIETKRILQFNHSPTFDNGKPESRFSLSHTIQTKERRRKMHETFRDLATSSVSSTGRDVKVDTHTLSLSLSPSTNLATRPRARTPSKGTQWNAVRRRPPSPARFARLLYPFIHSSVPRRCGSLQKLLFFFPRGKSFERTESAFPRHHETRGPVTPLSHPIAEFQSYWAVPLLCWS